ncbi:MAG TPA: HEAT repeat domain-containing protein [Ignavibacteriaceae bacterium]|jgi:hypothetical protein|nr:HEAT repeat domain-containing protein [Ignavibacteriaceae bacterium]
MKNLFIIAVFFLLFSSISLYAESNLGSANSLITAEVIDNYMLGINSGNEGVKLSSAYLMGEYKITDGVIPLMKILHNGETEEARIIAALSLIKIGTPMAVYSVKEAAKLDDSERVRRICKVFYDNFMTNEVHNIYE